MYLVNQRMKMNYSQRKVARIAGISYQHYSKIENGERGRNVSLMVVGRIAQALEIPLEEFYFFEQIYQEEREFNNEL
ncbi:MAG: helix-turn-helix transcriptional regulator [Acholeplasmataceae bacterium]|nr:helix-turn-helix transcriptional regulator [Acholeplasmataceae bacterium]